MSAFLRIPETGMESKRGLSPQRSPSSMPMGAAAQGTKGTSVPSHNLQPLWRGHSKANSRAAPPLETTQHPNPIELHAWSILSQEEPSPGPLRDTRKPDLHHCSPNAWKTPSRHHGAKPSPKTGCNKVIQPRMDVCVPTGRAGPKLHPVRLPGQQGMQCRASPHRATLWGDSPTGLCFVFHAHRCIQETCHQKQSWHQTHPSPFHPTPERMLAHGSP